MPTPIPQQPWLDAHAGAVQAAAALVQLLATLVLVGLTIWYARSAKRQAEQALRQVEVSHKQVEAMDRQTREAHDQVVETIRTRRLSMRPFLYVAEADVRKAQTLDPGDTGLISTGGPHFDPAKVDFVFTVRNVGPGAALGVRGCLRNAHLETYASFPAVALAAASSLEVRAGPPKGFAPPPVGQTARQEAIFWLEYRDMFGQWWATRCYVRLGYGNVSGVGIVWYLGGVFLSDHRQEVRRIPTPQLQEDKTAVDWGRLQQIWESATSEE